MTVRTGMSNLIMKVRELSNAGTADFTLAGSAYFSDAHIQDILDANVTHVESQQLLWLPDTTGGGSIQYFRAAIGFRDMEEIASGTSYWIIRDSIGGEIGTAGYSVNYVDGIVRFTADQEGSAYYLTGRSYDVCSAAADVWQRKQGFYSEWYKFSGDGQSFERQQAYEHAVSQEKTLRMRAKQNTGGGDLHESTFVRTDINGW